MHLDAPDALAASLLIIKGKPHIFGAHIGPPEEAANLLEPFESSAAQLEALPYRELKRHLANTGPGDGEDLPFHRSGFYTDPIETPIDPALEYDFSPLGGAYARSPSFPHARARFLLKIAGRDQRTVDAAMPPGSIGVYVNFPEPDRDPWDPAYLGANRERLLGLRDRYRASADAGA
jgi:hypothetical protein